MYIYNITFATDEKKLDKLIDWIKRYASASLTVNGDANNPRLMKLVPSPCEEGSDILSSVCLQLEFATTEDFQTWQETTFPVVIQQYTELFSPEPLFFASLLEEIEL